MSVSNIANFRVKVSSALKLVKQLTFKTLRSTQAHNEALHSGNIESNLKPDRYPIGNLEPDRAWASPSPEGRDLGRG